MQVTTSINEHLLIYGDGPLSAADDPYVVDLPNCSFFVKSNPVAGQGQLTYRMVRAVAAGLWQWTVIRSHTRMLQFEIEDPQKRILGDGFLLPFREGEGGGVMLEGFSDGRSRS